MIPDNNPATLAALWESLSEPVRSTILATALGVILAMRQNNGRSFGRRLLDLLAGAITGLILGYILHMAGFAPWLIWSSNVAIAYLGVDKVREIIDFGVDKYIYKKKDTQ